MKIFDFREGWWHYVSVFAVLLFLTAPVSGQFVQVGTPSGTSNTSSSYPTPFGNWYEGSREQYLYPAGELAAAGIGAGDITAIRFNVSNTNGAATLNNYIVKVGHTSTTSMTTWETGLTTVFGPTTVTPVVGDNTMNFTLPFTWDGTSNIVVEVCFQNTSYSDNASVEWTTPLPYTAKQTFRSDTSPACTSTTTNYSTNNDRRPITSFEATLAACPPPGVAVTSVTSTSADLDITLSTGDFYIEYGAPGFTPGTDANAGGGTVSGPFTTSPQTISGLSPSTVYDVYVRQDCGTEWSLNGMTTFSTACGTPMAPFTESFESYTTTTNATWDQCITATPNNTTSAFRWNRSSGTTPTTNSGPNTPADGGIYAFTEASSGSSGDVAILDLGLVDISSLSSPILEFYYHMYGSDINTLNVNVSDDGVTYNTELTLSGQQQSDNTDPWLDIAIDLSGYSNTVYVQFEATRGASWDGDIAIDNIQYKEAPTCGKPLLLTLDSKTNTTADISWTCAGCTGDFYVEYGAPGFTPGVDATAGTGTVVGPIAGNSTTLSGLTPNTDYEIVVRQDCGGNGFSENSSSLAIYTGACIDGGPTSIYDTNVGLVTATGVGGSTTFSYDHCVSPGGADLGYLGVNNQTALSIDVAEGITSSITVAWEACDASSYSASGSVWVDWNSDLVFDPSELIGSTGTNGVTETYSFTPPSGVSLGAKTVRVMLQEGGSQPLDPCASFSYGSVTDFTFNVVAPPACTVPDATFAMVADCGNNQFSIDVDLTDVGSSTGGVVDITNDGGAPALTGVGVGTYTVGPFAAGTSVSITIENLDDPLCNLPSTIFSTDCQYCAGGPSSTSWTNVEQVDIIGFAGSSISHTGCNPAVTGVEDLTALSVDIPNGFSYDLHVDFGSCTSIYGAAGAAWVDWNGDTNFDPSELVGSTSANPFSASWAVTPPPGTQLGPKVMRIMQQEGGSLPLDPCASFTWGSVMDFTVNVIADPGCTPPAATASVAAGSCVTPTFSIDITVSSTGDSPGGLVNITNDGGAPAQNGVGTGTYTFGPFADNSTVNFEVEHLGNNLCNSNLSFTYKCPLANDDCVDAQPVPVNSDLSCSQVTAGTITDATASIDANDCGGTTNDDVWYSFVATQTTHAISLINVVGSTTDMYHAVYTGTCGSLTNISCSDADSHDATGLTPGNTYYVRVYTWSSTAGATADFDLCIGSYPPPPSDDCGPYTSTPNVNIPDNGSVTDVITVPAPAGGAGILDLDVAIDVNHTYMGDVRLELTSPCGTTIMLFDGSCGSDDDMQALFDDESTVDIATWCSFRIGDVMPVGSLSDFDNEVITGDWTLTASDIAGGISGTLIKWCLIPTLGDVCLPPIAEVTGWDDTTISLDVSPSGCFDIGSYTSYDVSYDDGTNTFTDAGVSMPHTITGLTPGTPYTLTIVGNCAGGPSAGFIVNQATNLCASADLCSYELILSNSSGTGFGGASIAVNNGWTNLSYSLHPDSASETFTVLACAGTSLSLTMNNGGNGDLSSNYGVSLVNSTDVEVFGVNGPSESIIYTQNDGCPDCAPVTSVLLTRTAADLVELSWTNIQPVGDVDDIFIDIYMDDIFGSIPITNLTVPAGTNSASVNLGGSYAFSEITIDIITNCTGGGNPAAQVVTTLPGCDAVDQCEYVFDMNSASGGWGGYGLEASINGGAPISVNLTGSSGSQTVYACSGGTLEVSALTGGGTTTGLGCNVNTTSYGSGTLSNNGNVVQFTTCNYSSEYATVTINDPGIYEFTATNGRFLTLTDNANNIVSDGAYSPMQAVVLNPGTYRLHINVDDNCTSQGSPCITTTGQYISPAGCAANDFSLTLNPSTDNVPLVTNTNFCDFGDGEVVYSGSTCPDCYAPIDVVVDSYTDVTVDVSWSSFNPAGTAYTVHVGLPGFSPGDANEVATASGTTAATGAQGPVTVSGLTGNTDYEAIVVENCGGSPADASPAVAFTTDVTGDVCTTAIPLTMQAGGGCPAGATTASFADMSSTGNSVSCIDFALPANRDMWFSFNSGNNEDVSLYIEIDASEFLVVEVFQGCGGPVIFCENGYGSPQFIDVNPNEDYLVRVISSAANLQDAHVCVSPPSGCTDPNALNYDDRATVDDGSCYDCSTATSVPVNAAGACPASQQMFDNTNSDNTLGNFVSCVGATIPSRDDFYTFNSGTSQAVDITLDLGTAGYLAIEVFMECSGQPLYCESGVQGATTISLGVQQNTDYTIRIVGYDNLGLGTYFLCVMEDANPSPGCTDPNAPNYDPTAGIDDGSCIDCGTDTGVTIVMEDSFGDGWNGGSYSITSYADPLNPVVVATGSIDNADEGDNSFGRDFHCLADGCYEITVNGGSYPSEITWGIQGVDYGDILNQDAPATVSFTINTASCPVVGCTDSNAINWNPLANVDDGSCLLPTVSCGPDSYSHCYGPNAEDEYYYTAASGSDLYMAITGGFLENTWDYAYIYDGHSTSANLLATLTGTQTVGQVIHSTTGEIMVRIESDGSGQCTTSGYTPFTYQIRCDAPATSTCATAQSIGAATYPAYSTTVGNLWYIANDNAAVCSGNQGPSKYYTFTVTEENHYVAKVNPYQGADVVLEVLDGCGGTVLECIDNAGAGGEEVAAMQDLAPGTYILRVHNVSGGVQAPGTGGFLVRLQQLPIAGVQDNPNNFLYACNQGGFFLEDFVGATPQTPQLPGVLDWKWLSADVGGTFSHTFVRGSSNYAARITWLGMVPATTYNVFVSVQLNHPEFGPIWTNYGGDYNNPNSNGASACTISTAASVTPTELLPAYASPVGGPFSLCDIVIAHNVSDAENFQWRFDPDVNTPGDELIYTRGSGNPSVRLSWVNNIQPGVIYSVAVRAMVNGQWGTFGVERMLELQPVPQNVSIRPQYCGGTYGPNSVILSESVCEADYYRFRLVPVLGGPAVYRTSGNYVLFFNGPLANLAPGDYYLDVKISQNGQPGDFGPDCIITIAGPQTPGQEGPAAQRATTAEGDATLFPNPNAGDEVRVELNGLDAGNHDVSITVYDIYGKMLTSEDFGSEGQFLSKLIRFDQNLSMGVYMIHVRVDGALFSVERLVVK